MHQQLTESNVAVGGSTSGGTEASAAGDFWSELELRNLESPHSTPRQLRNSLDHAKTGKLCPGSSNMAPLCHVFHAENLPDNVNTIRVNFKEKRRKGPAVNLKECQLLEMVQYSCNPPSVDIPQPGVITCQPITRLFRR